MISYSFPKTSTTTGYLGTGIRALRAGDFEKISSFFRKKVQRDNTKSFVELLLDGYTSPIVVDYGCGLGYTSFELAQRAPS